MCFVPFVLRSTGIPCTNTKLMPNDLLAGWIFAMTRDLPGHDEQDR